MKASITSKRLTLRYSIYQLIYFSFSAGISAFAATYLLEKGFNTTQIGMILSVSNLLACFLQPLIGDVVDRFKKFVLPQLVAVIFIGVILCLGTIEFLKPPLGIFGFLYGTALFLASITNSLNNSLCAYYTNRDIPINYGVGQGVGSLSFSFASLGYGYVMALLGVKWMIWIVLILAAMLVIVVLGYPKISDGKRTFNSEETDIALKTSEERVSIIEFFGKYKLFVCTLVGVMLIAMCHTMSENYFIAIFKRMGGGSENVGAAMFVACISAVPFYMFFEKLRKKHDLRIFMKASGVFFMLKMILLIFATQVWHVYLIQLLQTFTYGFVYQPLYYLARQSVSEADLVKGQAVTIAFYTLGGAVGSFVGGRIIDLWGVEKMLWLAFVIAFAGTVIINGTLRKERSCGALLVIKM
ncbi:MAG: MFS transporter [Dorea sp.]